MKLEAASFEFSDADVAQIAREGAPAFSLIVGEPDERAAGSVVEVKGVASDIELFASHVADLGGRDITRVNRFYLVPVDAPVSPDELVAAAATYPLRALCPDEPTVEGDRQIEIRNQPKWIQDRFAAYLTGLGIHHA